MSLESVTEEWMQQLDAKVVPLYLMAVRARLEIEGTKYFLMSMQTLPGAGPMAGFGLTAGLPVVTMVGVYVSLGLGYYQARQLVSEENSKMGFAEGFVMAILGWSWRNAADRFGRRRVLPVYVTDDELNTIRVKAYDSGLKAGYIFGIGQDAANRSAFLDRIRRASGSAKISSWSNDEYIARNQQISFVIELATAALRTGVIKPE